MERTNKVDDQILASMFSDREISHITIFLNINPLTQEGSKFNFIVKSFIEAADELFHHRSIAFTYNIRCGCKGNCGAELLKKARIHVQVELTEGSTTPVYTNAHMETIDTYQVYMN